MINNEDDEFEFMCADFTPEASSLNNWEQSNETLRKLQNESLNGLYAGRDLAFETSRAADFDHINREQTLSNAPQPTKQNVKDIKQHSLRFPSYSQADLSTLHLFCSVAPVVVFSQLKQFFEDTPNVDPEVNEDQKVVFGNYYARESPQICSFLASVGKMKDSTESVLDVRRLDGDAFLLNDFFKMLKNHLVEKELAKPDIFDDDDEEDDEDDLWGDDDEDDDLAFDDGEEEMRLEIPSLDPHKIMMEFEYDPEMLYMMISDFKDTHLEEKNYFMSMLSHNAVRAENRNLMLDEKMHDQVKELIEIQLKTPKKDCASASLTRNTCVFLKNLTTDMEVDDVTVKAASQAIGEWCPGRKDDGSAIGELQGSRQCMIEISEVFQYLIDGGKYSEETILNILSETLSPEQITRIGQFTSTRDEESLQLFGSFIASN